MRKELKSSICFMFILTNVIFAKTIQVKNPGNDNDIQPNLQAAVNSAVNGDIVVIPAGQFVVNKNILITKFVSIKGQGLKNTILYRSESTPDATLSYSTDWECIFKYDINNNTPSNILVSDLTLKSKKPSLVDGDGLSRAEDMGIRFIKCIDFVVTRCRFENFGNGAVSVTHNDSIASGLIYKNEFSHNYKGRDALGLGYGVVVYGENKKWIANARFGSSNFIFVEDNVFDAHRHSIAAGGAALYVFRYNKVNNNNIGDCCTHAVDAHGANGVVGSENRFSTRAIEVYNNDIINETTIEGKPIIAGQDYKTLVEKAICVRGGEALIHDNYIKGFRFGATITVTIPDNSDKKYPLLTQTGYLSALGAAPDEGDVFVWNNTFVSANTATSSITAFYNYNTTYIQADRDYHLTSRNSSKNYIYPHPLRDKEKSSVSENINNNLLTVFPNPASGIINISLAGDFKTAAYEILSIDGATVTGKTTISSGITPVNVDNIAKGIYFVRVTTSEKTYMNKIVLQ